MNQQDAKELAKIDGFIADYQNERAKLLAKSGGASSVGDVIATELQDEEDRASLFYKMSSAELMRLYETDREEWNRVMEATQSSGMRKLLRHR